MRLHDLFESHSADKIVFEFGDTRLTAQLVSLDENSLTIAITDQDDQSLAESKELVNEVIPLAVAAVGAGISAYDAYRAYQDYRSGEIDQSQLAQRVGTNIATGLIGGGIGKIAQAGARGARAAISGLRNRLRRPTSPETPAPTPAPTPAARPAQPRTQQPTRTSRPNRTSRIGRAMRRGLGGGLGGGAGDYSNPLQRAVGTAASFESAETFKVPVIPGVQLDRITESGEKFWIYKVW